MSERRPRRVRDYPLILRWDEHANPLPVRAIRMPARRALLPMDEAPPWFPTGSLHLPFDFCGHVRRLLADIVARCETLTHVQVPQLLLTVTQARNGHAHGLQARVTPLRFPKGKLVHARRGVPYQVQRYFLGGHEYLYLMSFCLPRFLNQDFDHKLTTIFHELYHIGPEFDGDLRRYNGRYCIHSHSQRCFDEQMSQLARAYLRLNPDPSLLAFLRLSFAQLQKRHGSVLGVVVPRPKLVPVARIT
jgi:predicted metallopeptidase